MAVSSDSQVPRTPKLGLEPLEDRTTPVFLPRLGAQSIILNGVKVPTGGASIAVADIIPEGIFNLARSEYITGTGPGREGLVRIWDNNGSLISQFVPFPGFKGGINVAAGDVLGDGANEIVVSIAANGPPHVKVFNSAGGLLASFFAFTDASGAPSYLGGINIAVGNVLNEDRNDTPDGGVFSGGFSGGNNGSYKSEIIVGSAGGGIQGHVKVFNGLGSEYRSFNPFAGGFLGGVSVAAASIDTTRTPGSTGGGRGNRNRVRDTNAYAEIIVGATSAAPHVKVFSAWRNQPVIELQSYFAFDPASGQGITVTAGSTDGIRGAEIYASLIGAPVTRIFNGETTVQRGQFQTFPVNYTRVVNMAIGNVTNFDPRDDDEPGFGNNGNPFFNTQDLVLVTGDGPYEQIPRVFFGKNGSAAGLNGP